MTRLRSEEFEPVTIEEIKRAMLSLNMSRAQFGHALGVSIESVHAWLQGKNRMPQPIAMLMRIFVDRSTKPNRCSVLEAPASVDFYTTHAMREGGGSTQTVLHCQFDRTLSPAETQGLKALISEAAAA